MICDLRCYCGCARDTVREHRGKLVIRPSAETSGIYETSQLGIMATAQLHRGARRWTHGRACILTTGFNHKTGAPHAICNGDENGNNTPSSFEFECHFRDPPSLSLSHTHCAPTCAHRRRWRRSRSCSFFCVEVGHRTSRDSPMDKGPFAEVASLTPAEYCRRC